MKKARKVLRVARGRKGLAGRGLWCGVSKRVIKNPVPNVSLLGPGSVRIGPGKM